MSILGPAGLERVAGASQRQTTALVQALTSISGVRLAFSGPRFHEAVLQLDRKASEVVAALAQANIAGGYDLSLHYPQLGNALLVCATETKTDADIAAYAQALGAILGGR
jgi:glycine dehydrogenase subunit 1